MDKVEELLERVDVISRIINETKHLLYKPVYINTKFSLDETFNLNVTEKLKLPVLDVNNGITFDEVYPAEVNSVELGIYPYAITFDIYCHRFYKYSLKRETTVARVAEFLLFLRENREAVFKAIDELIERLKKNLNKVKELYEEVKKVKALLEIVGGD